MARRQRPASLTLLRRWVDGHVGEAPRRLARKMLPRPAADALRHALRPGSRHHCIISGTGRAGTSFLIQLLTRLGADTGFTPDNLPLHSTARAGLELDIRQDDAPYVVKTPWLCDYIEEVLDSGDIVIDRAIIPMRSIDAAAQSRIRVERLSTGDYAPGERPGGLWGTGREAEQERILLQKFYALLWPLVREGVPITFLAYPRLVLDPAYLHERLNFLFPRTSPADFQEAWRETVRPEWVHRFGGDAALGTRILPRGSV